MPDFAPCAMIVSASRSTHPLFMALSRPGGRLYQPPPKRRDHHPVLRGRLGSSVSSVSTTGSETVAGAAGGAGTDGGALSPRETGAASRTVERRRGASGSGACASRTGAGWGGGG